MGPGAVLVEENSQVSEARRMASNVARDAGLDDTDVGRAAIIATEMATNMVRHAGSGELMAQVAQRHGQAGFELLALDRGPGMANVESCLRDGYSTAGGSGTGLGAMRRLSSEFDIYSRPEKGSAILARIWGRTIPAAPVLECAGVAVPMRGETACGDAWTMRNGGRDAAILVADGLGHGPAAARASETAVRAFSAAADLEPAVLMPKLHAALRSTRGAAVAVARLFPEDEIVRFAGIGNIGGAIVSGQGTRQLVSHAGTVGHELHRVQEFVYPWPAGSLLVLYSDGIVSHWSLDSHPGLYEHDASLIAGVLYRDHSRRRDDATVVVARTRKP